MIDHRSSLTDPRNDRRRRETDRSSLTRQNQSIESNRSRLTCQNQSIESKILIERPSRDDRAAVELRR
jgi:hypothetical protein